VSQIKPQFLSEQFQAPYEKVMESCTVGVKYCHFVQNYHERISQFWASLAKDKREEENQFWLFGNFPVPYVHNPSSCHQESWWVMNTQRWMVCCYKGLLFLRDLSITIILHVCAISTSKVYNSVIQTNKLTLEHCLKYTLILKKLTVMNMTVYLVFQLPEW